MPTATAIVTLTSPATLTSMAMETRTAALAILTVRFVPTSVEAMKNVSSPSIF